MKRIKKLCKEFLIFVSIVGGVPLATMLVVRTFFPGEDYKIIAFALTIPLFIWAKKKEYF